MRGPGSKAFAAVARFDKQVIDSAVEKTSQIVKKTASIHRRTQNGMVKTYALGIGIVPISPWHQQKALKLYT